MAYKVGMVSLGCSKNQVDAEIMLALIQENGFELCADAEQCDVVIINTCGFIEDAKKESIETILEFCQMKAEGKIKVVVVTGCLAERYQKEVALEIPEADVVLGIGCNGEIVKAIKQALAGERVVSFADKTLMPLSGNRVLANAPFFAYVKLADGCNNRCAFCAIPLIRGDFRSRPMEDVLDEVKRLAAQGVKEVNVVAATTSMGGWCCPNFCGRSAKSMASAGCASCTATPTESPTSFWRSWPRRRRSSNMWMCPFSTPAGRSSGP